jgi:4-hydroxy-tetrahydrodipicolinate synthase
MRALTGAALDGDFDTALDLQRKLLPLIDALFSDVNPIPVKAAMQIIGYDCGDCRLPLGKMEQEKWNELAKIIKRGA